ncbi:MAG TPA: cyclodeaminase/cyclohydrolase family protein [Candidatus Thermoplasmatota archaeon]|nr:cyclodeaminase/cyclohydrolase family protein [Candidatus Thermoplasmatota archaeon]
MRQETLEGLLAKIALPTPTPGGGTAAALLAALGCALGRMVVSLTVGKEKYREVESALALDGARLDELRGRFLALAEEDAQSFEAVLAARRMPKATPEEQALRQAAVEEATTKAAAVPLETATLAVEALSILREIALKGNPNAATDAGTGALACHAATQGALLNVRVNVAGLAAQSRREEILERCRSLEMRAGTLLGETLLAVQKQTGV